MVKVRTIFGDDYFIRLYSNNNFIGRRKVYFNSGNYYVKFKGRFGEIIDFNWNGILSTSVDVKELYFRK